MHPFCYKSCYKGLRDKTVQFIFLPNLYPLKKKNWKTQRRTFSAPFGGLL